MSAVRRSILLAAVILIVFIFFQWFRNIAVDFPFRAFTVTLDNKSDYTIDSIETGIVSRSSKHVHDNTVHAGKKTTIKPNLQLTGEGAVYLKFSDSRGHVKETVVCGYTESLSGNSKVTIYNDRIDVQQNCL